MKAKELEHYQKLSKFQKEVVDALIDLGFKRAAYSSNIPSTTDAVFVFREGERKKIKYLLKVIYKTLSCY